MSDRPRDWLQTESREAKNEVESWSEGKREAMRQATRRDGRPIFALPGRSEDDGGLPAAAKG